MADCEVEIFHITSTGTLKFSPADYEAKWLSDLKHIYTESKKRRGFPEDACFWTSSRLKGLGLRSAFGWFQLDYPVASERGLREAHNWNLDSVDRIIDLTLPQMNCGLEQKLPDGILIINPDTELYRRFTPRNCSSKWGNEI